MLLQWEMTFQLKSQQPESQGFEIWTKRKKCLPATGEHIAHSRRVISSTLGCAPVYNTLTQALFHCEKEQKNILIENHE